VIAIEQAKLKPTG